MIRKNLHITPDLDESIGAVRHDARFKTESAAIRALLEGAIQEVSDTPGYVYLAFCKDKDLLKIGHRADPSQLAKDLSFQQKAKVEILVVLRGSGLIEINAHMIWGQHKFRTGWFRNKPEIRKWFEIHDLRVKIIK